MKAAIIFWIFFAIAVCAALPSVGSAVSLGSQSALDNEAQKVKYPIASSTGGDYVMAVATDGSGTGFGQPEQGRKSPTKAFLLSAAVPGLGQYYYGSRVKPFVFLGVEVAAWTMYFKWHGDGNDLTDAFEAFQRAHWSRDAYENKYLAWAYGETDDDLIDEPEVSHHLPETETQQFFEMTGKYDQFAWGWDDAVLGGNTLDDYSSGNPPPRIVGGNTVPYSARRLDYEEQRDKANRSFDKATRMLMVSVANHLVSALEAFLVTKHRNENPDRDFKESALAPIKVDVRMKSYHAMYDTPFVKLAYTF